MMKQFHSMFFLFLAAILLNGISASRSTAGEQLFLVHDATARVAIVAGDENYLAASKLQSALGFFTRSVRMVKPSEVSGIQEPVVILLGTLDSNPAMKKLAARHNLLSEFQELNEESYLISVFRDGEKDYVILGGGGRVGALYAVYDFKNFYWETNDKGLDGFHMKAGVEVNKYLAIEAGYIRRAGANDAVWIDPNLHVTMKPRLRYRFFWNWDNRTHWDLSVPAERYWPLMMGGFWGRDADGFLRDLEMCIDFMSEHKLNGLILWGFLRESHGGTEAFRKLCEYANERGVKIIPGIGVDIYGGFYFEGENKFNISTWLQQHPELAAINKNGQPIRGKLCMSKQANREWFREGVKWLAENFAVGGVNLEYQEGGACYCEDCRRARANLAMDDSDTHKDMVLNLLPLIREMHALKSDLWITYATYESMSREAGQYVLRMPPYTITQFTLTGIATPILGVSPTHDGRHQEWPAMLDRAPGDSFGLLHWSNVSTAQSTSFLVRQLPVALRKSAQSGLQGVSIYGEESGGLINQELNYLTFAEYCINPDMTEEEFIKTRLAPLWGGEEAARGLLKVLDTVGFREDGTSIPHLQMAIQQAQESAAKADAGMRWRWHHLIELLQKLPSGEMRGQGNAPPN
jgi:hypothetical protein